MKLGVLTSCISRRAGGVVEVVRPLARALTAQGIAVSVLSLHDNQAEIDLSEWSPLYPRTFRSIGPARLGFSPSLSRALSEVGPNLLHVHGLWMYPSLACIYWNLQSARPYVVSPHGMLHPKALMISSWKKKPAAWLYENYHLKNAACIHATTESEAHFIRKYGVTTPICIIPNGIELPPVSERVPRSNQLRKKVLLYLGRLHPQKGLLTLLRAWEKAQDYGSPKSKDWCLKIAGWSQCGHEDELKLFCRQRSLHESVSFVGPHFGEEKETIYRSSDAFVLPSSFESFGMVVLEAWAHKLPVLMTQGYLSEGFEHSAAIPMETSQESMAEALSILFSMGDEERQAMGGRGYRLAAEQFSWDKSAASMKSVYEWIVGIGNKPACIFTS